jgi:hypothetical protein
MAFSFDESEFAEQSSAAEAALKSLEASPPAEDPDLADVDRRLEVADHYRAILNHEFFDDTESPAAQIVDREIRAFVRERLEVLLGLRIPREPVEAVNPFSDEEIKALKAIAAKVLGQRPTPTDKQSAVRKISIQPQTKSMSRSKPQARKIPAPPPAPSTKPKAKPGPKPKQEQAQAPEPKQEPESASKQLAPTTIDNPEVQTFVSHEGKSVTLTEGEIIEENGQRFIVSRNEKGTLYRKNITGQVVPKNRLPPMTPQQLSLISQQQAEAQIAALDQATGLAVLAALKSQ